MSKIETVTEGLHGMFRDVVRDARGQVTWDSGWRKNAIVTTCRSLLASFIGGAPANSFGIQGLAVGAGLASWDQTNPPLPTPAQTALVDPNPYTVLKAKLDIAFLDGAVVTATPTNRLQIIAHLGPNVPPWPDANHVTSSLREFGLVGTLGGNPVLINYVTHPVITKDPASTLDRTIWLVF